MKRFALLSAAIHAAMFILLTRQSRLKPAPQAERVEITYAQPKPPKPKARSVRNHPTPSLTRQIKSKDKRNAHASRYMPRMEMPEQWQTSIAGDGDPRALKRDLEAKGSAEWRPEDWGVKGTDLGEIANYLTYEKLFTEIDGALHYPAILARRGYAGTINARLAFTDQSQCDWQRTQIKIGQQYLRIYVLTLLKKICSLEVIRSLHADHKKTVDISFQFELNEGLGNQAELRQANQKVIGNVLMFHRAETKSSIEYHLGPITGVWFVPAVSLDIPWIVEKWDYFVNGVDPLEPFRE